MSDNDNDTFDLPPEAAAGAAASGDDYGDDALTPDEFDKLASGITHPEGDYVLLIAEAKYERPTAESTPAGLSVKFTVDRAPAGATPKNGTWDPITQQFNEFFAPDAGKKKATEIANRDKAGLAKAAGVSAPDPADGKIRLNKALVGAKGRRVLAAVVHEKGKDGRTYQRVRNYRPLPG